MATKLSKQQPNRIIIYLALAGLLVVGLWLRVRFVHTVQLFPDEFVTLLAVQMIGEKGLPLMPSGLFYEHGLLFSYVGSLASFFGPARLAVRYTNLVFGLLTVGLTFFVGRRWFSPAVGLIAAAGLTIAPAAIHWSGRARMYALLQLLVLLILWLAYEGLVYDNVRRRWIALLIYLGAALTHFGAVTLAPPLVLAAIMLRWLQSYAGEQGSRGAPWRVVRRPATVGNACCLPVGQGRIFRFPFDSAWWVKHWYWWWQVIILGGVLVVAFLIKRAGQPKGIEALVVDNALSGLGQVLTIYGDFSLNLIDGWRAISPFYLTLPPFIYAPFALLAMVVSLAAIGRALNGESIGQVSVNASVRNPKSAIRNPKSPPPRSPALFLTIILLITTLEMILFVSPDRRDDKYLFMLLPVLFLLGAQGMAVVTGHWLLVTGHWSLVRCQTPDQQARYPQHASAGQVSEIRNPQSAIRRLLSLISPLLVSGLILTLTQPAVQALLANTGDDYDSAFAYVKSRWQPGDTILTGTPTAAAFYLGHNDFYSVQRRGGYDYRILTVNDLLVDRWLASPAIRTEAALHHTLANHNVWLVLERWGLQREYYDLPFQQQLLAQTDYVDQSQGIFILRSKPDPRPLPSTPARPAEAVFGDLVRLIGYTIEPEKPAPGQTLRLTLDWQALAPMWHDYTVFVHLRRPAGGNVAQADHRPLGNLYPTTLWPVAETIRESSDLFLPPDLPPGDYDLWAGLYLLETGQRLPVQNDASGENAVELGVLVVGQ